MIKINSSLFRLGSTPLGLQVHLEKDGSVMHIINK